MVVTRASLTPFGVLMSTGAWTNGFAAGWGIAGCGIAGGGIAGGGGGIPAPVPGLVSVF